MSEQTNSSEQTASRRPIYLPGQGSLRLISVPNGLWQLQEHIGRPKEADPRTVPNWRDRGRSLEHDAAVTRLKTAVV